MDHVKVLQQAVERAGDDGECVFVHKPLKIVQFDDDNAKASQRFARGVEQHRPFCALDIHLEDEITCSGRVGFDPIVERDSRIVVDDAEKFRDEMDIFAPYRRRLHGSVREKTGDSALDQAGLEGCAVVDPR